MSPHLRFLVRPDPFPYLYPNADGSAHFEMNVSKPHLSLLLQQSAERWPEATWLCQTDRELTFAEGWQQTVALASTLREGGLQAGDRMVVVEENGVDVALLFFAAMLVGAVPTLLHPQTTAEALRKIIEQTEPKLVVLGANLGAEVAQVVATHPWVVHGQFTAAADGGDCPVEFAPDDLAFLVFTSGSTCTPRGVMLTHSAVTFVSRAIMQRLDYQPEDRILVVLPLSFDVGLYQLFYALVTGCSVWLGGAAQAGPELPLLLARAGITVLPAVPTLLGGLLKMQRFRPTALPQLRMITTTGDHLPASYLQSAPTLLPGTKVYPMYGLTECKRVSILLPEEVSARPESVGRALDGTRVYAADESGYELPPCSQGELCILGPHLAAGYWRAPEETAKRYRSRPEDGARVLHSADTGYVDAEGYIFIRGRSDFVIKHRGFRLHPAEVEDAACTHSGIASAACVKDEPRDQLCLFVVGADRDEEALRHTLCRLLEPAKVPDRILVLPELPKTANQKTDRKALRALLNA